MTGYHMGTLALCGFAICCIDLNIAYMYYDTYTPIVFQYVTQGPVYSERIMPV